MRQNLLFGLVLFGCAAVIVLATVYRAEAQIKLEEFVAENCRAIEALKASEREEALDSYRNLDRTLRILGLERTPEIEAVARENRDATLRRFAAREC